LPAPETGPPPEASSPNPVAVVTGGNRGLGREVCRQLAELGFSVVLGSRILTAGEREARRISPRVTARQLDVTDQASVDAVASWVSERFGRCDAVVNNAGIDYDSDAMALEADLLRVRLAMETNLFGAWRVCLAFLPLLRASPHARIVNVSSLEASLETMGTHAPGYRVSKAALNALTRMLGAELATNSVLVNAVSPGWTATDMGGTGGRPISDGASSIVWGVMLPDGGPTGGYFQDGRPLPW
jgi:NAD(P)-dependent dehydrogenase (short-subunit alcohol dehydrogenase family)